LVLAAYLSVHRTMINGSPLLGLALIRRDYPVGLAAAKPSLPNMSG
jgi:hypothetical protein